MRPWLKIALIFATTILAVWLIWSLVIFQILITSSNEQPSLQAGDRVLVNRCSFGLRLPCEPLFGYHRFGTVLPQRGDRIAFNDPISSEKYISERPLCIGTCAAIPGDTVWLRWKPYNSKTEKSYPFVVPGKDKPVNVSPWNMTLLANALHAYEHKNVCWDCDSLLVIDGMPASKVQFKEDYLWILNDRYAQAYDSRLFGLLPASHLVGKLICISYSKDSAQPFYKGYRHHRFLLPIKAETCKQRKSCPTP